MRQPPAVLSPAELDFYDRCGFVEVRQAFSPDLAISLANEVWDELKHDRGIDHDDPSTWRQPHRAPKRARKSALNKHLAGERFRGVISDLRGTADWRMPADWGGFLVTFPDTSVSWDVPTDTWHWDSDGTAPGPFIFSFYSEVRPQGGGTLILSGSPRLLAEFYRSLSEDERRLPHKAHRRMFSEWDPWLTALTGRTSDAGRDRVARFMEHATKIRGVEVRVVELCGRPGDAVFCSPLILHAIAPNASSYPRLMRSKFLYS